MSDPLKQLMQQNCIAPISYYFAQFVAQQSGMRIDSILCVSAALVSHQQQQGDICIDLSDYAQQSFVDNKGQDLIVFPNLEDWIKQLNLHACVAKDFSKQPLLLDNHYLYLGKFWYFEQYLAAQITQRLQQQNTLQKTLDLDLLKTGLKRLFVKQNDTFDDQKLAAALVALQPFSVISGGPGTGKTTTLIKVITLLLEQNSQLNIQLCAPTGKAAIRMLQAINKRKDELQLAPTIKQKIPQQAKTIHRLLAYARGEFGFNEHNPLMLDCLIIDEASMIDLELMVHLFKALPSHCKIILLGDKDQLSSVDAGHVFSDICGRQQGIIYSSQMASHYAQLIDEDQSALKSQQISADINNAIALLTTSYRFDANSGIGQLAQAVNANQGAQALELFNIGLADLNFISNENDELSTPLMDLILQNYAPVVNAKSIEQAIDAFNQFQVLCAVREGEIGINNVNALINQRLLNRHLIHNSDAFNGMPIILTQNDYEHNLFNGDVGLLWIEQDQYFVYFEQDDGLLQKYPLINLNRYETAWAITVHKSQGSEYPAVALILPSLSLSNLLKKELIYTGITRAKQHFTLYAQAQSFSHFCSHNTHRSSNLVTKLGWN